MPTPTTAAENRVQILSTTPPPLTLKRALLFYEGERETLITEHPVCGNVIAPGRPLDTADFINSLAYAKTELPILDDFLIIDHPQILAWWRPSRPSALFGKTDDFGRFPRVSLRLPAMVFCARPSNQTLYVRALAKNTRPCLNTPLSVMPTPNVYDNGSVCLGITNRRDVRSRTEWERIFFDTRFTHTHYTRKFHACPGGPSAMIQLMRKRFRPQWLVPSNETLEQFVRSICPCRKAA